MSPHQSEDIVYCTWTHRAGLPPLLRERLGDLDHLLRDLIISATSSVLLVAPYLSPSGVKSVKDGLAVAAKQGAFIRIVTENLDTNGGLNRKAIAELVAGDAGDRIESRLRVLTSSGPLPELVHAKLLVVDGQRGYLGSANLSQRALESNFEIGLSLHPRQAETLEHLISYLESNGHLAEMPIP